MVQRVLRRYREGRAVEASAQACPFLPSVPALQPWVMFREVGRVLGCCFVSALKAEVLLWERMSLALLSTGGEGQQHACDPGQLQVQSAVGVRVLQTQQPPGSGDFVSAWFCLWPPARPSAVVLGQSSGT